MATPHIFGTPFMFLRFLTTRLPPTCRVWAAWGGMPVAPLPTAGQAQPRSGRLNTPERRRPATAQPHHATASSARMPYVALQRMMLEAISDCTPSVARERLTHHLSTAPSVRHLWQLRSDVYDLVATQMMQQEASRRINALTPRFKGWVPDRQLTVL